MTHVLAHNFLRLVDWDHRVLRPSSYIATNTVAAWNFFLDEMAATYQLKTDQPFVSLGDILTLTGQATLSAIAYDPSFSAILFAEQFIKAYLPGAERRTQFIGAHGLRLRALVLFLRPMLQTQADIRLDHIDAASRDVIRHEIMSVNSAFSITFTAFAARLDMVDEHILTEKRQETIIIA